MSIPRFALARSAAAAAIWLGAAAAAAQPAPFASPPCAACVVVELNAGAARTLASGGSDLSGAQLLVTVDPGDDVRQTVEVLHQRGARVLIEVPIGRPPEASLVDQLAGVVIDLRHESAANVKVLAFAIKQRSTEVKARASAVRVAVDGDAALLALLISQGVAAYVDFIVPSSRTLSALPRAVPVWIRDVARAGSDALAGPPDPRAERVIRPLPPAYVSAIAAVADVLPAGLIPMEALTGSCDPACRIANFVNPSTLAATAIVDAPGAIRHLQIANARGDPRVFWIGEDGTFVRTTVSGVQDSAVPARIFVHAAEWIGNEQARFATGVQVRARPRLTVEEILARHQEARARQQRVLRTLISFGHSVLTFEAPGFVAPITITAETVVYAAPGLLELEQRDIRIDGLAIGTGSGVPRLPLVEPERITTPPLALTLSDEYRYRLDGEETIAGRLCYIVAFSSVAAKTGGISGRAWISALDFGSVRIAFTQQAMRGPIVSNEQRDDFMPGVEQGTVVWLPWRTEVHQMYEGPAHRTPIHRVIEISSHQLNPPDFAARLDAAHAGPSVMLRDTAQGFRYLDRRASSDAPESATVRVVPPDQSQRVRTLVAGTIIDPNITRPLPFAGVSFLDFNLFGTGTQLNAFAGLGFGRVAFTTARLGRSRWQLVGDATAIAARFNDRVFVAGRERYEQNLSERPAEALAGIMGPIAPSLRLRAEYDVEYTELRPSDTTAADFALPDSPLVHSARLALDVHRGAWTGELWWSPAWRQRWHAWGTPVSGATPDQAAEARAFQRFGASLARSFIFSRGVVGRADVTWMDGRDLDRFSRYTFGTFDNRLRGYPAASIRYDRGIVAHGAISVAIAHHMRADGFVDFAAVREPGFGSSVRRYPGFGGALEAPLPAGLLVAAEWGYGVRGLRSDGREGTHVMRVSVYKMF